MTTKGAENVEELVIPASDIEHSINYAIDIGGSRCKVAFRKKLEAESERYSKQATIVFATFPRDSVSESLAFIRQGIYVNPTCQSKSTDMEDLHTTGISLRNERRATIEKEMHVRVTNISEFCLMSAVEYLLKTRPFNELVYQLSTAALKREDTLLKEMGKLGEAILAKVGGDEEASSDDTNNTPPETNHVQVNKEEPSKSRYPYLVVCFGSGVSYGMVTSGSEYQLVDASTIGGITLLSLAKLLVGTSDYNELLTLAERGDEVPVSNTMSDFQSTSSEPDFYDMFPDNELTVFDFGKVLGDHSSARREDLARTLVCSFIRSLVQSTFWIALAHNCRTIYISGGLVERELMREEFHFNFAMRRSFKNLMDLELHSLKMSSYLPVLGTLLENATAAQKLVASKTNTNEA